MRSNGRTPKKEFVVEGLSYHDLVQSGLVETVIPTLTIAERATENQVSKLPDKAGYFLHLQTVHLINLIGQL